MGAIDTRHVDEIVSAVISGLQTYLMTMWVSCANDCEVGAPLQFGKIT